MTPLVVGSYNIHRGVGLDRRRDLDRIARVIGEIAPDVIGLQEVVRENGVAAADQAMYLAARLDMTLVMGETRAFGSAGTYGNAVLTRLPVLSSLRCDLSCDGREPRGCLRVDLGVNDTALHIFNCHFGLGFRERRSQVDLLAGFLKAADCEGPRLVVGDFNEWHRGPVTRGLRREFSSPMRRMRRTHPAWFPLFRLDRITQLSLTPRAFTPTGAPKSLKPHQGDQKVTVRFTAQAEFFEKQVRPILVERQFIPQGPGNCPAFSRS